MTVGPAATTALTVWAFVLGASIGSFVNVMVYRIPRGMSVASPPSACPACGHPIRRRHNVPVVGWLVLRGRCRDCRAPIPARYAIVEAAAGACFAVAALVVLQSLG